MATRHDAQPISTGTLLQGLTGARNTATKDAQRMDVDTLLDALREELTTEPESDAPGRRYAGHDGRELLQLREAFQLGRWTDFGGRMAYFCTDLARAAKAQRKREPSPPVTVEQIADALGKGRDLVRDAVEHAEQQGLIECDGAGVTLTTAGTAMLAGALPPVDREIRQRKLRDRMGVE